MIWTWEPYRFGDLAGIQFSQRAAFAISGLGLTVVEYLADDETVSGPRVEDASIIAPQ